MGSSFGRVFRLTTFGESHGPAVGCVVEGCPPRLPLGVDDFLKRTSFVRFEPPKLRELGQDIMRLAQLEGLTGHGLSVDLRLQKIRRARREREAARESEAEL